MIYLDLLSSEKISNEKILQKNLVQKKGKFSRKILVFRVSSGYFMAGELTMEWLLFFLKNNEDFLGAYLSEYNQKPPQLTETEAKNFFEIMFADFGDKKQNSEKISENIYDDVLLSVAMAVRHMRLSYSDIMGMLVGDFYALLANIEVITGVKPLEDKKSRHENKASNFVDSRGLLALKNGIL